MERQKAQSEERKILCRDRFMVCGNNIRPTSRIQVITINAVPDKVEWYKKIGFKEMGKDIDSINKYMYIDLIKNKQQLVDYCEEQLSRIM